MRFINDPNDYPEALALWLLAATEGLHNMEDIERIKAEILAHFHDAFAAGLKNGLSAAEAERQAIAGLGDPKAARRKYLKSFQPRGDERTLEALKKSCRPPMQIVNHFAGWLLICTLICTYVALFSKEKDYFSACASPLLMGIVELYPALRAYLLLNSFRHGTEAQLKRRISAFYAVPLLVLSFFPFDGLFKAHPITRNQVHIVIWVNCIALASLLAVYLLIIVAECKDNLRIMRKVREQKLSLIEMSPNHYV